MVEITVCEESLKLRSCIFGIEKQNIASLSGLYELFFSNGVLGVIKGLEHGFDHNLLLFALILDYFIQICFPLIFIIFIIGLENNVLTLSGKVQNQLALTFLNFRGQQL